MKFTAYLMVLMLSAQSGQARRGTQSSSRPSAPHSSFHPHHTPHHSSPPHNSFVQRPHQAAQATYHPPPSPVSHVQYQHHPQQHVQGSQILQSHAQPYHKPQSLPQAPPIRKTVTTTTHSTYIPPPKPVVTTHHVTHVVQTPHYMGQTQMYQPYHPSGFNIGGTHVHLHMGLPTMFGGSGLYETGPAAYGETHWTHSHYHRSSILGEIIVLSIVLCLITCLTMVLCALCKATQSDSNEPYMQEYEEEQGLIEYKHEVKQEVYENYQPHQNEHLQDHAEEHVEYIYHPDGGRTEKRTIKNTQYEMAHDPTQASQGPMSSYGMQFNNQNQRQQYNYPYHNPQSNQMY